MPKKYLETPIASTKVIKQRITGEPIEIKVDYFSLSDSLGRCHYNVSWWADYHPGHPDGEYRRAKRGQCRWGDPKTSGYPSPEEVIKGKNHE